jgi:hypothetical protein
MSDSRTEGGFLFSHLVECRRRSLRQGLPVIVVALAAIFVVLPVAPAGLLPFGDRFYPILFVVCVAGALGLMAAIRDAAGALGPRSRHPAVVALGRYGEPCRVADAVDAEMADPARVVKIGHRLHSFRFALGGGTTRSAEAYLTPTWLVCLTGSDLERLTVFRLEDIVLAARAPVRSNLLDRHDGVRVIDRHGVYLDLPFREADAVRFLAEVLARVPWAVNRFAAPLPPKCKGEFTAEGAEGAEEIPKG